LETSDTLTPGEARALAEALLTAAEMVDAASGEDIVKDWQPLTDDDSSIPGIFTKGVLHDNGDMEMFMLTPKGRVWFTEQLVALGDLWEHEADEGVLSMAVESLGVTQEPSTRPARMPKRSR
jgi:hypothetical protein